MLVDVWVFGPERGCLMRVVPVIQEMNKINSNLEFRFFVHRAHISIVKKVLEGVNVEIVNYGRGLQFVYDNNFDLRIISTLVNITTYATAGFIKHFLLFRKMINRKRSVLVINDFMPFTPVFSRFYGIPVLGLYNYVLKETSLGDSFFRKLLSAGSRLAYTVMYGLHSRLLLEQLMPGSDDIPWETIPVIARKQTRSRKQIRSDLDVLPGHKLIFISLGGGGSTSPVVFLEKFSQAYDLSGVRFLVSPRSISEYNLIRRKFPKLLVWNPDDFQTQDLIAASDLIIARTGFTTVAESVRFNVPLMIWSMRIHPEIRETEKELQAIGAAAGVLYESDSPQIIRHKIEAGLNKPSVHAVLRTLPSGGEAIAASRIFELLNSTDT